MVENFLSGLSHFAYLSPKLQTQFNKERLTTGTFANQSVQQGELLVVWSGVIVDEEVLSQLPRVCQQHSIQVEENLYLISIRSDEPADYINHSCDPNAGLSGQITLVAMRDINPGEEICFDYAMSDGSPYDEFDCTCGSSLCRRRVTAEDWMRPELWERYQRYFSPYLQRRIELLLEPAQCKQAFTANTPLLRPLKLALIPINSLFFKKKKRSQIIDL